MFKPLLGIYAYLAYPQYGWNFPERTPEKLERPRERSQSFSWNSPREYGWERPKSQEFKAFEASRAFLALSPAQYGWGCLFFFQGGSGEGLWELVMELTAVLRAFLNDIMNHTLLPNTSDSSSPGGISYPKNPLTSFLGNCSRR